MHQAEKLMYAHLTCKPTVASLGVLYGLLIGADAATKAIDWPKVHGEMRAVVGSECDREWLRKLDRIKKEGWDIHDACAAYLAAPTQEQSDG